MKKILTILLTLTISTSVFGINIKIINKTSATSGWKVKLETSGQFITRYRYVKKNGNIITFSNIPLDCTVQIVSTRNIGKGTALTSGSRITLRKDLHEEEINSENITITIKECNHETTQCKNIMSVINNSPETRSEGNLGKNNKYYYLNIE